MSLDLLHPMIARWFAERFGAPLKIGEGAAAISLLIMVGTGIAVGDAVPEGVEGRVPFKGSVHDTLHQLMGGIRSGMGYLGAHTLQDLHERASFIRISSASLRESHVHDVWITKEPPNYSSEYMFGETTVQ